MSEVKQRANGVVGFAIVANEQQADLPTLVFTIKGAGETRLDMTKLADSIVRRAAIHGLKQRVSDAAAMSRDPKTGLSAPAATKLVAMAAIVDHYNSGATEWRLKGDGTRITSDEVLLVRALAEVYPGRDAAKLRAYVAGLTKPERTKLLQTGDIKVAAEMLREQDAQAIAGDVDVEALLAKMDQSE